MRGKEAVQSANRRCAELQVKLDALKFERGDERATYEALIDGLKREIGRLRAELLAEASKLAAAEVERRIKKIEDERRQRGLSDDIVRHLRLRKDRLIMNACRYLSMAQGLPPEAVFPQVLTWCTDKDVTDLVGGVDFLIELGVPTDGWVANSPLRRNLRYWRKVDRIREISQAISLDHAEEIGDVDIHPDYNPKWYPCVQHGGIEIVDSPEATDRRNPR